MTLNEGNEILVGPLTLGANGVVSFNKKGLSPGKYVISDVYSGTPTYDGGTGSAIQTVR